MNPKRSGHAALISVALLAACGGGASSGGGNNNNNGGGSGGASEFIAEAKDFAGYQGWDVADYTIGESNPALGTAHMGSDGSFSRRIFRGPTAKIVNGEYPVGSILVKETFTWDQGVKKFPASGAVFAMAKRGKTFNPKGGGWEWIELSADGTQILKRGGEEMMGGMCNACHAAAASQAGGGDSVFPHPSQFPAVAADFANYNAWSKIDEDSSPKPLLGGWHKGGDPTAVRRTYKKQLLSKPDGAQPGYPVGTVIVKEVRQNAVVTEITAMVKRGGTFNQANNGWEWFMIDPATSGIAGQGADLAGSMCNGCHAQAKTSANGVDYVFKHALDPFNN